MDIINTTKRLTSRPALQALVIGLASFGVAVVGCSSSGPDSPESPASPTNPETSTAPSETATSATATVAQSRSEDLAALRNLLTTQNGAIRDNDFGSFYLTCAPSLRDSAESEQTLQDLLSQLPPGFDWLEFEFESVEFGSETEATVFYSIRMDSGEYFLGTSTGFFQKINGNWYSLGRGCV